MGGIPKTKKRDEILTEMKKVTDGVMDVIVYPSAADKSKNRGFAFVEYENHRAAAMARRKLLPGTHQMLKLQVLYLQYSWEYKCFVTKSQNYETQDTSVMYQHHINHWIKHLTWTNVYLK